ncbi:hypothetical protein ACWD6U_00210 [Streptomyces sp. NPDC005149]
MERSSSRLSGLLTAPATVAAALAPFGGAALEGRQGGYPELFIVRAFASAASALLALCGTPSDGGDPAGCG